MECSSDGDSAEQGPREQARQPSPPGKLRGPGRAGAGVAGGGARGPASVAAHRGGWVWGGAPRPCLDVGAWPVGLAVWRQPAWTVSADEAWRAGSVPRGAHGCLPCDPRCWPRCRRTAVRRRKEARLPGTEAAGGRARHCDGAQSTCALSGGHPAAANRGSFPLCSRTLELALKQTDKTCKEPNRGLALSSPVGRWPSVSRGRPPRAPHGLNTAVAGSLPSFQQKVN